MGDVADAMSLGLLVVIDLGIAWLNHQLRNAAVVSALRAERLDAIINTTVDGIIVISAEGTIEAFNRGQNGSLVTPSRKFSDETSLC